MKIAKNLFAGSMVIASAFASVDQAQAQQQAVKNIVLVHGALQTVPVGERLFRSLKPAVSMWSPSKTR